jgi:hypothetical protein
MDKLLKFISYCWIPEHWYPRTKKQFIKINLCFLLFIFPIVWFLLSFISPNVSLIGIYYGWITGTCAAFIIINYKEKRKKRAFNKD